MGVWRLRLNSDHSCRFSIRRRWQHEKHEQMDDTGCCVKLTIAERTAIFQGDHSAVHRKVEPKVTPGEVIVLAWSRGGKQILYRDPKEMEKAVAEGKPITAEIPRKPTMWIQLVKAVRHKDGEWRVQFEMHDEREPVRTLGRAPGPSRRAGLNTRWRERVDREGIAHEQEVPKRGEQTESFTPESERGYGTSGVDDRAGVSDEDLKRFAAEGRIRLAEKRAQDAKDDAEEARRKQERAIRNSLRATLEGLDPEGRLALLAAIEREIEHASLISSSEAA